ncbi:TRAP transporter substrate-binding protein, partial [Rhizobium pusense]|nr:TRAP transporter substrate-binding protein [Agrobacterium pusense]
MRKLLLTTTAIAFAVGAAAPAMAEFNSRNIRVSNGINQDHPVGNGIKAMQACLDDKSGGKLKLTAFWGGALGGDLQATQALRSGVQEAVVTSSSPLVGLIPSL